MMRGHTANDLRYRADILAADGTTVLASSVYAGLEDLTGARREQAQLIAAETSHMILLRTNDATSLTSSSYVRCEGLTYIVDYTRDPRVPRANVWLEVYCHVERTGS